MILLNQTQAPDIMWMCDENTHRPNSYLESIVVAHGSHFIGLPL
jgi:hypothetical protein